MSAVGGSVECPVCGKSFSHAVITEHANSCLNEMDKKDNKITMTGGVKRKSNESHFLLKKIMLSSSNPNSTSTCSSKPSSTFIKSSKTPKNCDFDTYKEKTNLKNERNSDDCEIICEDEGPKRSRGELLSTLTPLDGQNSATPMTTRMAMEGKEQFNTKPLTGPLADKVRPQYFDDYFGQTKAVGENSLLHSLLLKGNNIPSMILWGPPGCGKTTLAKILAHKCQRGRGLKFICLSATSASVSDVKELAKVAQNDLKMLRKKTILFLDEIHRFNKLQQDALLPHVENGLVTLIGATTENPSFHVNNALLSRCRVIPLDKLEVRDIKGIVRRACAKIGVHIQKSTKTRSDTGGSAKDGEDGKEEEEEEELSYDHCQQEFYLPSDHDEKAVRVRLEDSALEALSGLVDGDARAALNGLQMTVLARLAKVSPGSECADVVVTLDNVKEGLQKSHLLYDRNGDEHFNIASALIKSMRGSDDSAALYWLSRMLGGGENPVFVARRLIVFASEDVGLADSSALSLAVSTFQACQLIGMPECGNNLAHCVVYMCRAPKSVESYTAFCNAQACVQNQQGAQPPVPLYLRNTSTKLMKKMGYGAGYKYPPKYQGPVKQDYLPASLIGTDFFSFMKNQRPTDKDAYPKNGV